MVGLLAVGGSYFAGYGVASQPRLSESLQVREPIQVTAQIEKRIVEAPPTFTGTIVAGREIALSPGILPDPSIVTRQDLAVGDRVEYGDLLGVVSGFPYFAFPVTPLYRDLELKMRGDDVTAFQSSLREIGYNVTVTGVIDSQTLAAVDKLYGHSDLDAPKGHVEFRSFLTINSLGQVAEAAPVASTVGEDQPLIRMSVSDPSVRFRADVIDASRLSENQAVTLHAGAETAEGVIRHVGEPDAGGDGKKPGSDVVVETADEAILQLPDATTVEVRLVDGGGEEELAVPATAIRQDTDGYYLLPAARGDATPPPPIRIEILATNGGWVAIRGTEIELGLEVRVNG
ncbi:MULTISPECIES: efflux RND transporter periplasmic adaptor subunit [unclassified Salinibacterium]|uniref:efflux RND transporter periplasmic adaptor subunit n=1 Tax=unclassified Salinibacterium TaxID=2632331 RepID=UPI00141F85DD|nr:MULTISPECIES: efflux RND transporter periplasmic adaptor subunit [unclassified Salinibacterium]